MQIKGWRRIIFWFYETISGVFQGFAEIVSNFKILFTAKYSLIIKYIYEKIWNINIQK